MGTARFLPLALLALTLAACQAQDDAVDAPADSAATDHSRRDHGQMGHQMTADTAYSDVRFLDHMTMHHQMAVEMAQAVGDRGESAEVRRMAQEVIRAQTAEIDTMRAWRARWFPDEPAAAPMSPEEMAMMGMSMDMDAMRTATGAELDRQFLMGMVPHHAGAITMAAHAQMRSERPEILALARTIIDAQAREIGEMQGMISATSPSAPADSTGR
jgi:uncharacterized protein (DUF305 family)